MQCINCSQHWHNIVTTFPCLPLRLLIVPCECCELVMFRAGGRVGVCFKMNLLVSQTKDVTWILLIPLRFFYLKERKRRKEVRREKEREKEEGVSFRFVLRCEIWWGNRRRRKEEERKRHSRTELSNSETPVNDCVKETLPEWMF